MLVLAGALSTSYAQQPVDSTATLPDTLAVKKFTFKNPLPDSTGKGKRSFVGRLFDYDQYPNPKKATLMSLIVPGTGQIYNKEYLKVPVIYGLYAVGIGIYLDQRKAYRFYRDQRIAELDDDETTVNTTPFSAAALEGLRNQARSNAETSFLLLVVLHTLQTADAFVFAHLKSFDVNEDLSLRIRPEVKMDQAQGYYAGMGVVLSF